MGFSSRHYFWLLSVFILNKYVLILLNLEKFFFLIFFEGLLRNAPQIIITTASFLPTHGL